MTEATDRGYSELRTVGRETEDRLESETFSLFQYNS